MDEEYLKKPKPWLVGDLAGFMIYIGPISSIFDITTFAVMYFIFKANTPDPCRAFPVRVVCGRLVVANADHSHDPHSEDPLPEHGGNTTDGSHSLHHGRGSRDSIHPDGRSGWMVPLPGAYFFWLAGILVCYCLLTQVVKLWYIRHFGHWL